MYVYTYANFSKYLLVSNKTIHRAFIKVMIKLLLSPPNEVSEGTMKRAPYVCVCVRASVRLCVNEKCYFSSISWTILILFVLSDRAGWRLFHWRKVDP